jgi:peptidoglycan/LPS O-acetylase OafA/YrhL
MQPPKLGFIDSLRGFAALYVLAFHFSLITTPMAVAPRWLAPFTGFGGSGVTLFFVVSAFTLCLSTDSRKRDESTPLLNYFIRRFFRIAPLFYVWIIAYIVRDIFVFNSIHSPAEIARSVFFVLNLFPGREQGFVWASWTIGVEMLFYVFFPVLFKCAGNLGKATALFLFSLLLRAVWRAALPHMIADLGLVETYYNFSLLHHLPTFLFGIVVYRIFRLIDVDKAKLYGIGEMFVSAGIAGIWAIAYGLIGFGGFDGLTVEAAIYGLLLIGLAIKSPVIIVNRISRFYGRISYSVYLSHATTLFLMSKVFAFIYAHVPYVTAAYLVSIAIGLAVVTSISEFTYRFIETPGNALGKSLIQILQRRKSSSVIA